VEVAVYKTIWWAFLSFAWVSTLHAQEATVHFQSPGEARAELTEGAALDYFGRLQLGEMRAKTGLPLRNLSLEAARERTRQAYGASVEEFSGDEQAALRDVVEHLQPVLRTRAPLYARTPWSFIKVADTIEGGLPHTRGASIVLSHGLLAAMAQAHAKQGFDQPSDFWNLLVHEQTHVLQRQQPSLFKDLYTGPFGFRQVRVDALPDWLRIRRVVNPDAPDVDWAFSIAEAGGTRWYLPDILLADMEHPAMPRDFQVVALPIHLKDESAEYADAAMPEHPQGLERLNAFVARFPLHEELFHPNEIAAGLLAAIITGVGEKNQNYPLWDATRAWAGKRLR
jgi:hypothetical protein